MKWKSAFCVLCLLAALVVAGPSKRDPYDPRKLTHFKKGVAFLTGSLYDAVRHETPTNQSIVLSPLSIHMALGLLSLAADQFTAANIWRHLQLNLHNPDHVALSFHNYLRSHLANPYLKIANGVFTNVDVTIADQFRERATTCFGSTARTLNFARNKRAAAAINDWVAQKTNNLTTHLISADSLNANTNVLLVNALHFKADWDVQFPPENTETAIFTSFTLDIGHKMGLVEMMRMERFLPCSEEPLLDAKVLKLAFDDRNTTIVFILPNAVDGLWTLGHKLHSAGESNLRRILFDRPSNLDNPLVAVHLPKFEVELSTDLMSPLKEVGFSKIYSDSADFSYLSEDERDDRNLSVSQLIHKAVITVDEQGTGAADATATGVRSGSTTGTYRGPRTEFEADHPFMYMLIGGDHSILLVGDYVGPAQ